MGMESGIITLTTDFGSEDAYVGAMKGAILSEYRSAAIIDITHHIEPQNLGHAAVTIASAYPFFPGGTVHVVVVDPGVGTHRAALALSAAGHVFIAPDNGVLSNVVAAEQVDGCYLIENTRLFRPAVSRTFHGRDVFAPVAAKIAAGRIGLEELGPPLASERMVDLDTPTVKVTGNALTGSVLITDHFGNLITNITNAMLAELTETCACSLGALKVILGPDSIMGVSGCYGDVPSHSPLALIGSNGFLEVAVNQGNAREYFNASVGDRVRVTVDRESSDTVPLNR